MSHKLAKCAFIGVDVHKERHTAVLVDFWHNPLQEYEIINDPSRFDDFRDQLIRWTEENKMIPVFALEDTGGLGQPLARYLIKNGFVVKLVNPLRTNRQRKLCPHPDKSDFKDALAICKVCINEFDHLPVIKSLDEGKISLNLLSVYRDSLVKQQTRLKNQFHALIVKEYPHYQKMFKETFSYGALAFFAAYPLQSMLKEVSEESLRNFLKSQSRQAASKKKIKRIMDFVNPNQEKSLLSENRAFIIKELAQRLTTLHKEIEEVEARLRPLVDETGIRLETMPGVSLCLAAKIIGKVGDISRFPTADKFARYSGIAPIQKQSGKRAKFYKTRKGNRDLNWAIHQIALTHLRKDKRTGEYYCPESGAYYEKKRKEGKSPKEALTCLKRRLSDIIYGMLKNKTAYEPDREKRKALVHESEA